MQNRYTLNVNKFCLVLVAAIFCLPSRAQDTDSLRHRSFTKYSLYTGSALAFSGISVGLYYSWYAPYAREQFRFFNDGAEWKGIDKIGHFGSSWLLSQTLFRAGVSNGLSRTEAERYSALSVWGWMATIELMDGFSAGWGFSWYDLAANTGGVALSTLQNKKIIHPDIRICYSWQAGNLSTLRPEMLGRNLPERMLKNYNEQRYWLSIPLHVFYAPAPKWLCVSLGYSANGMLGAQSNIWSQSDGTLSDYSNIARYSTYRFSLDIDLRQIPSKNKFIRSALQAVSWIKIPAPQATYSRHKGFDFNPLAW